MLTPSIIRLDLKCGKGAISKGEKCTKGATTEAVSNRPSIRSGARTGFKWGAGVGAVTGIASGALAARSLGMSAPAAIGLTTMAGMEGALKGGLLGAGVGAGVNAVRKMNYKEPDTVSIHSSKLPKISRVHTVTSTRFLKTGTKEQLLTHRELLIGDMLTRYGKPINSPEDERKFKAWAKGRSELKEIRSINKILNSRTDSMWAEGF